MLNKAIELAAKAHAGQLDKGGCPYILHPLRVMLDCETDLERICAVLHDVVEDTSITLRDLEQHGFSLEVIRVLDCLTRRSGEPYDDFITRVLENETACRVKLADLIDNMDLTRIPDPAPEDEDRMRRYEHAADRIIEALPMSEGLPDRRLIEITGGMEIQPYLTCSDFTSRFLRFAESHGWYFRGSIRDSTGQEPDQAE